MCGEGAALAKKGESAFTEAWPIGERGEENLSKK